MSYTEDDLRDALQLRERLAPNISVAHLSHRTRPRRRRGWGRRGWVLPLASAAAVCALLIGTTIVVQGGNDQPHVAGIGPAKQHASSASTPPPTSTVPPAAGVPYSLYTHCGVREARVGAIYYVADTPLDDGHGNPPAGWGNPYQPGKIFLLAPSVLVFRDAVGHSVRFHARPGATSFLRICA